MRAKITPIFLLLFGPAWVLGADARQNQVAAAHANALDAIRQQIEAQPMGPNQTIRDLLDQTHSQDQLAQLLQRSPEIGGARWLDSQTCQVRVRVDGAQVADLLQSILASQSGNRPAVQSFQPWLDDLRQHSFEATSTSAAASSINSLTPIQGGPSWSGVASDARRDALISARQDAINHALQMLGPVELSAGVTVADQMKEPNSPVRRKLLAYLQTAPIVSVRFDNNLQVQVQLRPSWQETADTIYSAWKGKSSNQLTAEDFRALKELHDQIARRMTHVIGTAVADKTAPHAELAWQLPAQPPAWVDDQLDVVGQGFAVGSQLKSARAAEHDAKVKLGAELGALYLDPTHTVLDAARKDPHIAEAINQSLDEARPYKSEYDSDGSATIHVILNLRDFWQALQGTE